MTSKVGRRAAVISMAVSMLTVLGACIGVDVAIWTESYGPGPPYYGRTTNMDKWQDPSGRLVAINVAGLGLSAALGYGLLRLRGGKR